MNDIERKIESLLNRLQSKGAKDIIIKRTLTEQLIIRYSNNKISIPIINNTWEITLKIGYKNRYLVTSLGDAQFNVDDYADYLIRTVSKMPEDSNYAPIKKSENFIDKLPVDTSVIEYEEKAMDIIENVINESVNKKVKETAGIFTIKIDKIRLLNSLGIDLDDERETVSINHRCLNDASITGQWSSFSRNIKDLNVKPVIEKSTLFLEKNLPVKKIQPGKYDVILSPMIFAQLIERVAMSASAFSVESGLSFLSEKINEKVACEKLSIYDDPTTTRSPGYSRFDDEGIRTYRKDIIEKGILKTYLHNLTTAKKFNTESTGNAGLIVPIPWTIFINEGDMKEEEILKELGNGLLIVNSWYLRYQNYRKGDFSTVLRDGVIEIEKGEEKSYLVGARLSDNFLNIMNAIETLTNLNYPIKWWEVEIPTFAPYALIRNLNITTSE
jgi:PmbA protein